MTTTAQVRVEDLVRQFDLSGPWLERLLGQHRGRALVRAVDGVSFEIERGTTFALVGESGCGKSTIARCMVGILPPTAGRVTVDGTEIASSRGPPPALRGRVQMIFQDPFASLNPRWRIGDIVGEPLALRSGGKAANHARVAELLTAVGLDPADGRRYPHQFSGGQRQRISIARALASEPDFIVCDEPTSALDVSVQAQILNLMKDLQARLGLTYLFISHDLAVVHHMADRVGVMYLGRLCETADADRLFETPRHPYTRLLLEAVPSLEAIGQDRSPLAGEVPNPIDPPSGCAFHPRCPYVAERCRTERPELIAAGGSRVACHAVAEGR